VVAGYENLGDLGVTAFKGKLNIRPAFQREFVYSDKKRNAVIHSVSKNYPLNGMF